MDVLACGGPCPRTVPMDTTFAPPKWLELNGEGGAAGDIGKNLTTWVYGIVGDYLLDFWHVVLPFFIALAVFWILLQRLGLSVARLEDGQDVVDENWARETRRDLDLYDGMAARQGMYSSRTHGDWRG